MLSKEEIDIMFDLAGKSKGELPPDIPEYIMDREIVKVALRTANQNNATDEDWKAFIESLKRKCVNGHLKTGTFGHEKSSTKSWKLIPPLHQSDLVEPNGCEFGSCHRAG